MGIPAETKNTSSLENPSTLYTYNKNLKGLFVSYVVKNVGVRNFGVLRNHTLNIYLFRDTRVKAQVIVFYDRKKRGADV